METRTRRRGGAFRVQQSAGVAGDFESVISAEQGNAFAAGELEEQAVDCNAIILAASNFLTSCTKVGGF